MKKLSNFYLLQLLLGTLIVSTASVLGKTIAMPTEVVIWSRSFLGMLVLFLFCKFRKIDIKIKSGNDYKLFLIAGVFMALHWITYFYAIRSSTVATGLLSLFTFPIMIAIFEPLFLKTKFQPIHILLGVLVLIGLFILVPEFNLANANVKGILFGLTSALFYTIRILILKQAISRYNGSVLMFYQTVVISIVLLPFLYFKGVEGWQEQLPNLLLLGILTTAIGHSLVVHSLTYFSASTSSIISSVQPIFGIILAFIFLNEIPTNNIYIGGVLILSTVVIESFRSRKK